MEKLYAAYNFYYNRSQDLINFLTSEDLTKQQCDLANKQLEVCRLRLWAVNHKIYAISHRGETTTPPYVISDHGQIN